jgi:hypothetical protein
MVRSKVLALCVGCSFVALGCEVAGPEQEPLGTAAQAMVWSNGDDPIFFWQPSTQAAVRALALAPLEDGDGALADASLASTASGQLLLHYLVGCALPSGATVYSDAAQMSFDGAVGLAPEWASSPLASVESQRWMTACLLQTLNGLGVHVPIRLAGSNPALDDAPEDASTYTVPDASMFGNLFLAGGRARAYACTDIALLDGCTVQASLSTLERICGLSPTCGITPLGPCQFSCRGEKTGAMTCTDPGGNPYPEAISSWLMTSVALTLPLCPLAL